MNSRQTSKDATYRVIQSYCDEPDHAQALRHLPAFLREYLGFKNLLPQIRAKAQAQQIPSTGVTEDKDLIREQLADLGDRIAAGLRALADTTENRVLHAESSLTRSDLSWGRHAEAADRAENLLSLARTYQEDLRDYGVTDARLEQFNGLLQRFSDSLGLPRKIISKRRVATSTLADLFAEADARLARLDNIAKILELDFPQFVAGYRACRQEIHSSGPTRSTAAADPTRTPLPLSDAAEDPSGAGAASGSGPGIGLTA